MKITSLIAVVATLIASTEARRLSHPVKWTEERECCKCPYDPKENVIVGRKETNGHNLGSSSAEQGWRQDSLPDTRCCPCTMANQWTKVDKSVLEELNDAVKRQPASDAQY